MLSRSRDHMNSARVSTALHTCSKKWWPQHGDCLPSQEMQDMQEMLEKDGGDGGNGV